jgi:hypothetical protein
MGAPQGETPIHGPSSGLEALDAVVQRIAGRALSASGTVRVAQPAAAVLNTALVGGTVGICDACLVVRAGVEHPAEACTPVRLRPAVAGSARTAGDREVAGVIHIAATGVVDAVPILGERGRPHARENRNGPGHGSTGTDPLQHPSPRDPRRRSLAQGFLWIHPFTPFRSHPSKPVHGACCRGYRGCIIQRGELSSRLEASLSTVAGRGPPLSIEIGASNCCPRNPTSVFIGLGERSHPQWSTAALIANVEFVRSPGRRPRENLPLGDDAARCPVRRFSGRTRAAVDTWRR